MDDRVHTEIMKLAPKNWAALATTAKALHCVYQDYITTGATVLSANDTPPSPEKIEQILKIIRTFCPQIIMHNKYTMGQKRRIWKTGGATSRPMR